MPEALLKREEVQRRIGYGRSKLFAEVAAGRFPRPVSIAANRKAWLQSEVDGWIAQRADERSETLNQIATSGGTENSNARD